MCYSVGCLLRAERTPVLVEWNEPLGWLRLCNLIMPTFHLKRLSYPQSGEAI